jgi:hypothetical protein
MANFFPTYEAARVHSEMVRQAAIASALAAYTSIGNAGAFATFTSAVSAADANHYDRLDAAAVGYGVSNGARQAGGRGEKSHSQTWLTTGSNSG